MDSFKKWELTKLMKNIYTTFCGDDESLFFVRHTNIKKTQKYESYFFISMRIFSPLSSFQKWDLLKF